VFLANNRAGRIALGKLVMLVVVAGAVYCAYAFGKVYWHKYALRDEMDRQLSYAGQLADETIRQGLVKAAAEMHLPVSPDRIQVSRTDARTIQASVRYTETVNLLFTKKRIPVSIEEHRSY
jgi:hypothetical protein